MNIYTLVLGNYATNTYVVIDGGDAVVIDPADNADRILDLISQKHTVLRHILLTHGHFDHIGAVGQLQQDSGATVYMSQKDYELIEFGGTGLFGAPSKRFELNIGVNDGDDIELIGHKFHVLATSGHTVGSVCYIMDDTVIFSGDTLFRLGIGRTDFPFGSYADMKNSLNKLFALPHDYDVLSGHGGATTLDFERKNNPYAN